MYFKYFSSCSSLLKYSEREESLESLCKLGLLLLQKGEQRPELLKCSSRLRNSDLFSGNMDLLLRASEVIRVV